MSNETENFDDEGNVDFIRYFEAPPLVVTLQDSPRFGHSTDITSLVGSTEEAADYTAGLIAATFVTILCFFIVFLSLPILMYLGEQRVGFLSGAALRARSERTSSTTNQIDENFNEISENYVLQKPDASTLGNETPQPEEQNISTETRAINEPQKLEESTPFDERGSEGQTNNKDSIVDKTQDNAFHSSNFGSIKGVQVPEYSVNSGTKRRNCCLDPSHIWVRGTFVVSGVIFILFSILLVTQGVLNLQTTIESVNSLAASIDDLALKAEGLLRSSLLSLQTQSMSIRDLIVTDLSEEGFCPANPSLDNSTVFAEISALAGSATASLSQLNDFLGYQVESLSDAINDAAKGAREVQSATEDVNIAGGFLAIILIPYTIVPFMLILAAILAHFDKEVSWLNSANRWFFMPFFFILVIIAAGTASGMIAAASANSDFCLPGGQPDDKYNGTSPDSTIWRVLDRKGHVNDTERRIADFYIDQCQTKPDPFLFLREYVPKVRNSRAQLNELLQSFQSSDTITQLSVYCNRSYDSVDELIIEMGGLLDVIIDGVRGMLELISCGSIVPIYHRAFYDSSCAYSVSAVFWVFSSSMIMGSFGLLMLLFRAACKPTLFEGDSVDPVTGSSENVVYDEELKNPDEKFVEENALVDEAEAEDANGESTPVANEEKLEVSYGIGEEANGFVTSDMANGSKS